MNQESLKLDWLKLRKTVDKCRVDALFTQVMDNEYEVVLNVSSQKFLLRFTDNCGSMWNFEILSAKWFVSCLTLNLIYSLKGIVEKIVY